MKQKNSNRPLTGQGSNAGDQLGRVTSFEIAREASSYLLLIPSSLNGYQIFPSLKLFQSNDMTGERYWDPNLKRIFCANQL